MRWSSTKQISLSPHRKVYCSRHENVITSLTTFKLTLHTHTQHCLDRFSVFCRQSFCLIFAMLCPSSILFFSGVVLCILSVTANLLIYLRNKQVLPYQVGKSVFFKVPVISRYIIIFVPIIQPVVLIKHIRNMESPLYKGTLQQWFD